MIEFRRPTAEENDERNGKYDTVMVCGDVQQLAVIRDAAKARKAASIENGDTVTNFDQFTASLSESVDTIFMERPTADDYQQLLRDYTTRGYLYTVNPTMSADEYIERGRAVGVELDVALRTFDIIDGTDFEGFTEISAAAHNPLWNEDEIVQLFKGAIPKE